jgi:PAS domain S-box-containing protein
MRLMRPLVTEENCLSCHAEQGYEVGEIRGGISVSIPMTSLEEAAWKHNRVAWLGHALLWAMGLTIIGGGGRALQGNVSKLQESEAQYRSLIQGIQAAVIVHDADGRVVTSNPTAQRLLGLSEEELNEKPTEDNRWCFLGEDGTPMAVEDYPVNQVFATGQPVRELVVGIPRGEEDEIKWALIDADPVFDEAGEINQVIVTFMDITSRKQAEEALKHSEEQYALALRAADAGSWDWDITSNKLAWSEQIEPLFGFERGEFEGTYEAFLQRVHPEDREFVTNSVNICLENNEDYAIEHRIVWPDGTVRWVSETGDVFRNNSGEPVRMLGVVQDITSRKRAEQEVLRQKDLLENTLESLTYPFFVVNVDDYTVQMANSAAIPPGDLPETLTCHALTHQCAEPCNTSEHPCPLQEVLSTKEPVMMEHVHYDDEGNPHYVEVNGYPIFDAEGDIRQMIEYAIDITERKLARKSLAEKKEALARSNAELEEFAYIASHDLQEPLRKVQAFGDRLKTRYGDVLEDRGQDYLTRMQNAAERMRNLIDDLLTYSRVTTKAKPFETVDLNDVMEDVVDDLVVLIEETEGQVEVDELPTVEADAVQLRRLFLNLIGNALKFHKEGEPPVVKVYGEMPERDEFEGKNIYQIAVEDNGIGFDEKYTEQIFAPFQRLHGRSDYEGTGMGLAICRKIVKRHSGRIWVESEPGQGTTFTFTLTVKS